MDIQPSTGTQPADRTRALIVLTDATASPCAVDGFATVEVGAGRTSTVLQATHLDQPGPGARVVLQGEGSAFAGLEWTTGSACPAVTSVWLTPPGSGTELTVSLDSPGGSPVPVDLCPSGASIGPFVATSEGTVDFPDSLGG